MRFVVILFFFLVVVFRAQSQVVDTYEFVGSLMTSDQQKISFKLILESMVDGEFVGHSVTNYDGSDYTESVISGKLSLESNILSFKETGNSETKSEAEASTFCYIQAARLDLKNVKGRSLLTGQFKGLFPSGKECATGTVLLISKDSLTSNLPEIMEKEGSESSTLRDSLQNDRTLTNNEKLRVKRLKNQVTLEVWDSKDQDHDMIDIFIDGEIFKKDLVLKRAKKTLLLPDTEETFEVKIVALNEGYSGINTVTFAMNNVEDTKDYVSQLVKGESFVIEFHK